VVGERDKNNSLGGKILGLINDTHYNFSTCVKVGIKNMETKEIQLLNERHVCGLFQTDTG